MIVSTIVLGRLIGVGFPINATGRTEEETLTTLQAGFDRLMTILERPSKKLSISDCSFETFELGQAYHYGPDKRAALLEIEDPHRGQVECDSCHNPFDPHNESHTVVEDHWICSRCESDNSPEELAEKLEVSYETICDAMGIEPEAP